MDQQAYDQSPPDDVDADSPELSQPDSARSRLRAGDVALIRIFDHPVTVNETHAALLGTSGFVVGSFHDSMFASVASIILILYALFGHPRFESLAHDATEYGIGIRTVRHEPWWFLSSYVLTFAAAQYAF